MSAITYRTATLDDAELASDLMSAAYPAMTNDPLLLRFRWKHPRAGFESERFIAEVEGRPVGFLAWIHAAWSQVPWLAAEGPRCARLAAEVLAAALSGAGP